MQRQSSSDIQKSYPEKIYKIHWKTLATKHFFRKNVDFNLRHQENKTSQQMFSCEFSEIFLKSHSIEHLQTAAINRWAEKQPEANIPAVSEQSSGGLGRCCWKHRIKQRKLLQKQPPEVFYEKSCSQKFHKIYRKKETLVQMFSCFYHFYRTPLDDCFSSYIDQKAI